MTSEQSLKLFDIVNRNFKSEADARQFVKEIDALTTERTKEEARQSASKEDLANTKLELVRWMFGFWITIVMLILGTFFLKK